MERMYEDEESYSIIMELLNPQKTLQDELVKFQSNSIFSYAMIKQIISQLLQGLKYIHAHGIMHRDLKPQNIMFADKNQATLNVLKIIDFGLAERIEAKKFFYAHVGTPGYVAPEILAVESEDHTYSEKCDIFSAGVIFHMLLTGKQVFPGKKFEEVLSLNKRCQINLSGERYQQVNNFLPSRRSTPS